jgi:hypothetical protein
MSDANPIPGLLLLPALGALALPWLGRSATTAPTSQAAVWVKLMRAALLAL